MAIVTATVTIDNQPLRRAFVEHIGPFDISLGFDLTDQNGSFSFDAGLGFNAVDVKIHCQNAVIRVLDGGLPPSPWPIHFKTRVANGATASITTNLDHYRILERCLDVYDTVWRQFRPYNGTARQAFPLGRRPSFRDTFANNRRLELSYPDNFPLATLAFVEPSGLSNAGFPLAHIKDRVTDGRLFGEGDSIAPRHDPSLLPHELGHVFHFAALNPSTRLTFETKYLAFLSGQVATGGSPFHAVDLPTDQTVAFSEATGIFSERFFFFARRVRPNLRGASLRQAFFQDELSSNPSLPGVLVDPYLQVGQRDNTGTITPVLTGNTVEGAVYGAIYLDFASRVGLREAVGLVIDSNATTFRDFRASIEGRGNATFTTAIAQVARTWGL